MKFSPQILLNVGNIIVIVVSTVDPSMIFGNLEKKTQRELGCTPTMDDYGKYGMKTSYSNSTNPFSIMKPFTEFWRTDFERPIVTERECRIQPTLLQEDPLWERALCPWAWKINYDRMRIPVALPEAICKCDKTVSWISKRQQIVFECELVYFTILVFRYKNGCGQYEEVFEDVPMGCIALKPNASPMNRGHLHNDTENDSQY